MRIRFRNIKRNENGVIVSGSATLVEHRYCPNPSGNRLKNHCKTIVRERLGKVLWMNELDKTCGIFNSATRGIVFYDLKTDTFTPVNPEDPRLIGTKFEHQPLRIHTTFGPSFLFFSELAKTPLLKVLHETFSADNQLYQKALAHLTHDCLKNGSAIKCGEFLKDSVMSYILTAVPVSELDCDSSYYRALDDDNLKVRFFTTLIREMRKLDPEFGRSAYVDSTPLPGEARNNPFNALCSHGTDGTVIQSRLAVVLDIKTGIPVWFEIFPANKLDKSTMESIGRDIEASMHIKIDMYDVDAGYARKTVFDAFNRDNSTYVDENGIVRDHTVLMRMPSGNGYPRDRTYKECKPYFHMGRYMFDYEHHTFFGKRVEINDLFGNREYGFVYIDTDQATELLRKWRTEDPAHLEEWNSLTDSEQDWYQVKDGLFMLVGNKDQGPQEALIEYRGRTDIEGLFRDGKTYLKILPLAKWDKTAVKGKIFHDILEMIFYRAFRKQIAPAGKSVSSLIVDLDSWECFRQSDDLLELKTPKTEVNEILGSLGYTVTGHMDLNDFRRVVIEGIPMNSEPATARSNRSSKKISPQQSPDERLEEQERKRIEKAEADAGHKMATAAEKAKKNLENAEKKADAALEKAKAKAEVRLNNAVAKVKREHTREKARAAYQQTITIAAAKCAQAKADARTRYDQAMAAAKETYELAIAAIRPDSKNQSNVALTDQDVNQRQSAG